MLSAVVSLLENVHSSPDIEAGIDTHKNNVQELKRCLSRLSEDVAGFDRENAMRALRLTGNMLRELCAGGIKERVTGWILARVEKAVDDEGEA